MKRVLISRSLTRCALAASLLAGTAFTSAVYAQVNDDFSDNDFTTGTVWTGSAADFEAATGILRTTAVAGANPRYLSTANTLAQATEWNFRINDGTANPSNGNRPWFVLTSDTANLAGAFNGYAVRFGEDGSADTLRLLRVDGGIAGTVTSVIDSSYSFAEIPDATFLKVRVTRDSSGNWTMFANEGAVGPATTQVGIGSDNTYTTSAFCGPLAQIANVGVTRLYEWDDILIQPIPVATTAHVAEGNGAVVDGVLGADEYGPGNSQAFTGGGAGFGGAFGGGTFYMDADATNLYIGFMPNGNLNDSWALFMNTGAGGFADADMEDDADPLRRIISRLVQTDNDVYPSGMTSLPDYAMAGSSAGIGQWMLNAGATSNHLTFVGSFNNQAWNTGTGSQFREVSVALADIGLTLGETMQWFAGYGNPNDGGSNVFLSGEAFPTQPFSGGNPGVGTGGTTTWNAWHELILQPPAATNLSSAFTSSADGLTLHARFSVAPNYGATNPASWTLNDVSGVTITAVAENAGGYDLTLSGAPSGDTTLDTLTFNNGVDASDTIDFYSGVMTLAALRGTVADANNLSTLTANANITVGGTVIEDNLDATALGRAVYFQSGGAGLRFNASFGTDIATPLSVGDSALFVGSLIGITGDANNGLQQLIQRSANTVGLLSSSAGAAPTPNTLADPGTLTPAQMEALEGTLVRLTNVTFTAGDGVAVFDPETNYDLAGITNLVIRIDADATGIPTTVIPNVPVNIVGVFSQFDNTDPRDGGYQIFPRTSADIGIASSISDWTMLED